MDCYNYGDLGHLAHQCPKPKKGKYKKKYKDNKDDSSDDEKRKDKPYKKKDGKKKQHHKKKNGKAYIVGDWLTDIELSSGSSGEDSDDEKEKVATLVIGTSLPPAPPPPSSSTHLCLMAKGERKVQSDDDSSGNESGSDSDDEFEARSYDKLVALLNKYSKIIRTTRAKNEKLELENESLLAKYDIAQKANDELRDENKLVTSTLKELKANLKELKEKHDKLEGTHNELNTRYSLLKDEYTTLKINYDTLIISNEFLSNETHDATNHVVKIDIATSCDYLIDENIEQGSSSKVKQVVVADHYDDYVKIKSENEKLKKDLEKQSINNTIVIETQDGDYVISLEYEKLKEENKKLKIEKTHLTTGLYKFTKGHNLQSELLMNTVMKSDKCGIGFKANQEKKAKAQHQAQRQTQHQYKPKPKPKRHIECGQEGHFAHDCKTPSPQPLPKHTRPFAYNAHYILRKNAKGKAEVKFLGPPNKNRPKQI
ncbi:uncharacterized protein [Miscanthus floridulus]|uniref:uncharacterized protein n=1 Tax=Miscanthus floridulus TaxID=154761 RepID=UPI0034591102